MSAPRHADRAVPSAHGAPPATRPLVRAGRDRGLRSSARTTCRRRRSRCAAVSTWSRSSAPRSEGAGCLGLDREPRAVDRLRGAALRRAGNDLRAGGRQPAEGGRDPGARSRDRRPRRDFDDAREHCERLAGRARLPLRALGQRAAPDRRRRHRHARAPRGRARNRRDHRPGRRRQRRRGRLHGREGAPHLVPR